MTIELNDAQAQEARQRRFQLIQKIATRMRSVFSFVRVNLPLCCWSRWMYYFNIHVRPFLPHWKKLDMSACVCCMYLQLAFDTQKTNACVIGSLNHRILLHEFIENIRCALLNGAHVGMVCCSRTREFVVSQRRNCLNLNFETQTQSIRMRAMNWSSMNSFLAEFEWF